MGQKQTPLFFPSPCRAEQVGRCRRGGTRAPESTHTTAKVAPIVKGKGKPIWERMLRGAIPIFVSSTFQA